MRTNGLINTHELGLFGDSMVDIDNIRIKNFKAFKDTGSVKLTKLNLVVGKNSAGKVH